MEYLRKLNISVNAKASLPRIWSEETSAIFITSFDTSLIMISIRCCLQNNARFFGIRSIEDDKPFISLATILKYILLIYKHIPRIWHIILLALC